MRATLRRFDAAAGSYLAQSALVVLLCVLTAAAVVCVVDEVTAIGYRYELDYGEAPLIDQAVRLTTGEPIYRVDLSTAPYTISNYPPGYIAALAAFVPWTGPAFWPGRLVSTASALTTALLIGLMLHHTTGDRIAGVVGGFLFLAWPYVALWSGLARIDHLALALSIGGLSVLVRWPRASWSLWVGGLFLVAAIFTRQSYALAAPAAACVWLWSAAGFKRALILGAWVAGLTAVLFGVLNAATAGGFFLHIVSANVNAFFWETVNYRALQIWELAGILVVLGVVSLGVIRRWNPLYALAAPYLIGAVASAVTIGKTGSNVNYLLEFCAALALVGGIAVAVARRQPWQLAQAAVWVALALQATSLFRETTLFFPGELPARLHQGADLDRLAEVVREAKGPVLADEQMGMITLAGQRLMLQPFEMTQLQVAGLWDEQPLLDDIRAGKFALILLYDVPWLKDRWTPGMFDAIDDAYRLSDVLANNRVYVPATISSVDGEPVTCPGAPWSVPTRAELGLRWDGGALNLFGHGNRNTIGVIAVADGVVSRFPDRPDAIAVRFADPLSPGEQVWMIVDGLADPTGQVSYVSADLIDGARVSAGDLLGAQGTWSGRPQLPMWVHARITLVRAASGGDLPDPIAVDQVLDPRPYFGLDLPGAIGQAGSHKLTCVQP